MKSPNQYNNPTQPNFVSIVWKVRWAFASSIILLLGFCQLYNSVVTKKKLYNISSISLAVDLTWGHDSLFMHNFREFYFLFFSFYNN